MTIAPRIHRRTTPTILVTACLVVSLFGTAMFGAGQAAAATYYVSTSGDDSYSGLSTDSAWLSIDNGGGLGVLMPGDTVNILPGTYAPTATLLLNTFGSADAPIVYRKLGEGNAIVEPNKQNFVIIEIDGNHIWIEGLELTGTNKWALEVKADSCVVRFCYVRDIDNLGIKVTGNDAWFERNVIANTTGDGIVIDAEQTRFFGNTVYNSGGTGVLFQDGILDGRAFNNIITEHETGMSGPVDIVAGFNLLWLNAADYADGIADSAGGVAANPLFVDEASGDYRLQAGSQAIDAGIDLGYSYHGSAPDIGALEYEGEPSVAVTITVEPDVASVSADATLQYTVTGYDSLGYAADPGDITWGLTTALGTMDASGLFDATTVGTGTVYALSDLGLADTTSYLAVTPGPLATLTISPDSAEISADSSLSYAASGIDSEGNTASMGELTWEVLGGVGTINADGVFTPSTVGTGRIAVASNIGGVVDTNAVIVVTPGVLATLTISPDRDTVSADSTRQFTVLGYDNQSNSVSDLGTLTWSVQQGIGTIDNAGLFDATTAGAGFVAVTSDLGPSDQTDSIIVVAGAITYIEVEPASNTVSSGDTFQFEADGYDADSNLVSRITNDAAWLTNDITGSIDATGNYTAGTDISPPNFYVYAEYASFRDSSLVTVITSGALSYVQIECEDGTVFGDTSLTVDNDTTVLYCRGYDAGDVLLGDFSVSWSRIDTAGIAGHTPSGGTSTTLSLTAPGTLWVVARHNSSSHEDTTGMITVTAGTAVTLVISPDTATLSIDSLLTFTYASLDVDGNPSVPAIDGSWSVLGGIGTIDVGGVLTPSTAGVGRVVVTGGGLADTSGAITVVSGALDHMVVAPDSIRVRLGDSVQFSVTGYDGGENKTDAGEITWRLVGRNGTLDANGLFVATRAGTAAVAATSSIGGVADTAAMLAVEELLLTTIPIGNHLAIPDQVSAPLLSYRLENYFADSRTIDKFTFRTDFGGSGNNTQKLSNVESLLLYLDADNDSLLSESDSLLDELVLTASTTEFDIDPFVIEADSGYTFLVAARTAIYPRDGDTLDLYIRPAIDIIIGGGTLVAGPDSANSLGTAVVEGMVVAQITTASVGLTQIDACDSARLVSIFDIPRNGYAVDTLTGLRVVNTGTANQTDFDSLILFGDNGNGTWDGLTVEPSLGRLFYTGAEWSLTGLESQLAELQNRFYVAADCAPFHAGGRTVALSVPVGGLEVSSGNDGPIDVATVPPDTIAIQADQQVDVVALSQPSRLLAPGQISDPVLTLELSNSYATPIGLDSISLQVSLTDPQGATQAQLDSQLDSLLLYLDRDSDLGSLSPADSLIGTAAVTGGRALFSLGSLQLPGMGGQAILTVSLALSAANARDGNPINAGLESAAGLFFNQVTQVGGSFPIQNQSSHSVNAFPAALLTVTDPGSSDLNAGDVDQSVFEFRLPGNGYASDDLDNLRFTNIGTLDDRNAIASMRLWADPTGDGFSNNDILVGTLDYHSGGWELSNAAYPIPSGGQGFILTVTVSSDQFESGRLQLQLATGACQYLSGLTGPDDQAVVAASAYRVYPADRITVISVPLASSTVAPGSSPVGLMSFALYNGYGAQAQSLEAISFTNNSRTTSTTVFADHELGQVSLLHDSDNNRINDGDPLVASGYFINGQLQFSGLGISLPADSLIYFFVTAGVPLDLIDSDSLDIVVSGPADLSFGQPVVINGDLPLQTGGYRIVNGSVAAQYQIIDQTPGSLSPGDTAITVFAFRPAVNGDLVDTLEALNILNLGDADSTDISSLELWLDVDADDLYSGGDSLLGTFTYGSSAGWTISNLGWPVPVAGATLLVIADIDAAATPGTSFRAQIPVGGCTYVSANDGPIDGPVSSDDVFSISASSLAVAGQPLDASYTIGQSIAVRFSATNRLASPLAGVVGRMVSYDDSATIVADSSSAGPVTLAAGQTAQFVYYYTVAQAGSIRFQTQAIATVASDSSSIMQTNTATTQLLPANVNLEFTNSIPTAVTKGQTNVFPFSLRLIHLGGATSASVRIDSLRLDISDGQGTPLAADAVFSRLVLSGGYTNLAIIDTVPQQNSLTLSFSEPVIVAGGADIQFSLLVDIDTLATATAFLLSFQDATALAVVDANSRQAVAVDPGVVFPLATASCRIDNPSQLMAVSSRSLVGPAVNLGQTDVDLIRVDLRHPGAPGSSQIQFTDITVQVLDSSGVAIIASQVVNSLTLRKGNTVVAELIGTAIDTSAVTMQLGSPVTLSPGEIDSIRIAASISAGTAHSRFSLRIADSLSFVVRDLSSGSSLETTTDTTVLATGSTFPIETSQAEIMLAALSPTVCLTSMLPASTVGGVDSLGLIQFDLQYPVSTSRSSIRVDQILVTVADTLGAPLDPANLFDRLGYRAPTGVLSYQQFVLTEAGAARFTLGAGGLRLDPGDSLSLTLVGDISIGSDIDHFSLVIGSEENVRFVDATDTSSSPGLDIPPSCLASIPFNSGHTHVYQPAGRPNVAGGDGPVLVTYRGQQDVTAFSIELVYDNPISQGDLSITGLHGRLWKRTATGLVPADESAVFDAVALDVGGSQVASDSVLVGGGLSLTFANPVTVIQSDRIEIVLRGNIRADAAEGNYVFGFEDSTCLEIADANLATTIYPTMAGGGYPIMGTEISVVAAELQSSFSNYPNPFNPDRGVTTIAYVLPRDAMVDIDLFTITGELVKRVATDAPRPAGANQTDSWTGRNGAGLTVVPGTYLCRITARYADGATESFRRKVAVIR